jgi:hypothetical protein
MGDSCRSVRARGLRWLRACRRVAWASVRECHLSGRASRATGISPDGAGTRLYALRVLADRRSSVVCATVLALATATPASGAMAVRLAIAPSTPKAGTEIILHLRTYAPYVDDTKPCGFRREPWRVRYPFRVQATAPNGTAYRVRVHQRAGNLYVGRLRLSHRAGTWTIRVLNFFTRYNHPHFDPCSGGLLRFRVRA